VANELRAASQSGATVYGTIFGPTSLIWNGTTFEIYSSSNRAAYVRTMTELGSSGVYVGDFPVAITTPGRYETIYYITGGVPAEGDAIVGTQSLNWDGTAVEVEETISTGFMDGSDWLTYVIRAFKRTDKTAEVFDATKDTIDDIRRRLKMPEDEVQVDIADQITVLGEYQMDLETDFGHLVGPIMVQEGNDGWDLAETSKTSWDIRYLANVTDQAARGRPVEFVIYGGKVFVGPVPDKLTYVYKMSYTRDPRATITAATAAVPFTNKHREVMRWGVLQRLYSDIVKNDDQAVKCGLLYENGLKWIEKRDDRNRGGAFATIFRGV